jgi:transposase
MATRRRFSTEYKQQAVDLARSGNKSISQVARDLGIDPNMLSRWCREMEAAPRKVFPGQGNTRDEELAALRRELAQVKKERDFLKEAAVFFAKDSK